VRQAQIRRNDIAHSDEDDVARNDLGGGYVDNMPIASDARAWCGCRAQRLERAFPSVFRDDVRTDDRDESGEDQEAISNLSE
jgi:hypothetical protein